MGQPRPESEGGLRWGVLGTGSIASKFTRDLERSSDGEVVAVGSRSAERAEAFRHEHHVSRAHPSYESLVADDAVDAVYVAVPHPFHHEAGLLALRAGKAVLVEKPFTMNASQAAELIGVATERGLFLMEAMWTRFLPQTRHIQRILEERRLGDVRLLVVEFGQWFKKDAHHRLFDPALGGGALLDLGVYAVSFASMVQGRPAAVHATSDFAFTGVDAQTAIVLQYEEGRQAVLAVTMEATLPNRAAITGTEAYLEIERSWYRPSAFRVTSLDGTNERFDYQEEGGLRYEAEEVARCIRAGLSESPIMPLGETLEVLQTMDEIRSQIGLSYPGT